MSNNGLISTSIVPTIKFKKYEFNNLSDYIYLTASCCNNSIKIIEPNGYGIVLPEGTTLKNTSFIITHIAAAESSELKIYDKSVTTILKYVPVNTSVLCLCTDKVNNVWSFAILGAVELDIVTNNGISISGNGSNGGIYQVARCTDTAGVLIVGSGYNTYAYPYTYITGGSTLSWGTGLQLTGCNYNAGSLVRADNSNVIFSYKISSNSYANMCVLRNNGSTITNLGSIGIISDAIIFSLSSEMITSTIGLTSWCTNPASGTRTWHIRPFSWDGTSMAVSSTLTAVELNPSAVPGYATSICKAGSGAAITNSLTLRYISLNGISAATVVTTITLTGLVANQNAALSSFNASVFVMSYYDSNKYPYLRLYAMSGNNFSVLQDLQLSTVASAGDASFGYISSCPLFLSATRIVVAYFDENRKIAIKLIGFNPTTNTLWLISKTPIQTNISLPYNLVYGLRIKAISSKAFVLTSGETWNDVDMINSNVFTIT